MEAKPAPKADWLGLLLVAGTLLTFCYVGVFGRMENWFNSPRIQFATLLMVGLGSAFGLRTRKSPNPIVKLHLLTRPNVYIGGLVLTSFSVFLAGAANISLLTDNVLGFGVLTTAHLNLWLVPGLVLGSGFSYGWFRQKRGYKGLLLVGLGAFTATYALYYVETTPGTVPTDLYLPTLLRGMGTAVVFIAGGLLLTDYLAESELIDGVVFMLFARSLLGVLLFSTLFTNLADRPQTNRTAQSIRATTAIEQVVPARQSSVLPRRTGGRAARPVRNRPVQSPALLTTARQLFGYVVLAGIGVLFVLLMVDIPAPQPQPAGQSATGAVA